MLSDDQLSQLNIHLHEALQQSRPVNIKYYEEGYINFIELIVHRIDSINYEIEGTAPHSRERHKVSFLDIIDISFYIKEYKRIYYEFLILHLYNHQHT